MLRLSFASIRYFRDYRHRLCHFPPLRSSYSTRPFFLFFKLRSLVQTLRVKGNEVYPINRRDTYRSLTRGTMLINERMQHVSIVAPARFQFRVKPFAAH